MACPACSVAKRASGPLVRFSLGELTLHGCNACRGVFVPARAWCILLSHPTEVPALPTAPPEGSGAVLDLVACPLCKKGLERGRFAGKSPVVVDLCDRHGIWLDAGELTQILAFIVLGRKATPHVDVAQAQLEASIREGDSRVRVASLELQSEATSSSSSGLRPLVLVAVLLFVLGSAGLGLAGFRKYFSQRGEDVKRAAESTERTLGR